MFVFYGDHLAQVGKLFAGSKRALNPASGYIIIDDEWVRATDGHVAFRCQTTGLKPGETLFISPRHLDAVFKLAGRNSAEITASLSEDKKQLTLETSNSWARVVFDVDASQARDKVERLKEQIDNLYDMFLSDKAEPIQYQIDLSPVVLERIVKWGKKYSNKRLSFKFRGNKEAVVVESKDTADQSVQILVMPLLPENEYLK